MIDAGEVTPGGGQKTQVQVCDDITVTAPALGQLVAPWIDDHAMPIGFSAIDVEAALCCCQHEGQVFDGSGT